jgi:hypothetical protein
MLYGLVAGVLLQSCVAMLPPARAQIEWFRDGRPFAIDVPVRTSRTERVYRRQPSSGAATVQRTLTCNTSRGVSWLTERTGRGTVRLPVGMAVGASQTDGGSTVRRIRPPADATGSRAAWYTVSNPGVTVYAISSGAGVVEVRSPRSGGGFTILRGVVRTPAPVAARAELDSVRSVMQRRIDELEGENMQLRDSIDILRARLAPDSARPPVLPPHMMDLVDAVRSVSAAIRPGRDAP